MNPRRRRPRDLAPELRELTDVPRAADGRVDVDGIVAQLAPTDVLETAGGSGWSYVIPHLGARLHDVGGWSSLHGVEGGVTELGSDPFQAIDDVAAELGISPHTTRDTQLPPFTGGLVGAFAYDLGRRIEDLGRPPVADRDEAHLRLRTVDTLVAIDPTRTTAVLVTRPSPFASARPGTRAGAIEAALRRGSRHTCPRPFGVSGGSRPVTTTLTTAAFQRAVRTILESISRGEVFQVNLARHLRSDWDGDVFDLYRALRQQSPAPFGAILPDAGLASISPETYLRVASGIVETRPIKGTRPRNADPSLDAALADDLATSEKDRAENVMVVDMERNDLGRVCRPGTIDVPDLTRVEAHPTVWHLVSTVRGRLRTDVGYGELLRATFPCGSITGAPKIAAMRLIDRLEPVRRGWYCGGIGFLGDGAASLSVAIRTAVLSRDGTVTYGAGSGIVADSEPDSEHLESLDKAAAFLRALGAVRGTADHTPAPA